MARLRELHLTRHTKARQRKNTQTGQEVSPTHGKVRVQASPGANQETSVVGIGRIMVSRGERRNWDSTSPLNSVEREKERVRGATSSRSCVPDWQNAEEKRSPPTVANGEAAPDEGFFHWRRELEEERLSMSRARTERRLASIWASGATSEETVEIRER